jgi:hypothetical protein
MNSLTSSTRGRLRPRTSIASGAALGLVVGATVYGAVSSSAEPVHAALKGNAPVALAPVKATTCVGNAKLEKGFCVTYVVRTVVAPSVPNAAAGTAAARPGAAPVAGLIPAGTVRAVNPGAAALTAVSAPKALLATPVAAQAAQPTPAPVPVATAVPGTGTGPVPAPAPPVATPVPTAAS